MAEAMLGKDAEDFFQSELGRYLLGRIEEEIDEAVLELKVIDSFKKVEIGILQNKIWRAEKFKFWLAELIHAGHQAMTQLEESQASD